MFSVVRSLRDEITETLNLTTEITEITEKEMVFFSVFSVISVVKIPL
jgi:hypothetical protein